MSTSSVSHAPAGAIEIPVTEAVDAASDGLWPAVDGGRVIFLLDASTGSEHRMLRKWIERNRPESVPAGAVEHVDLPPSRRKTGRDLDPRLEGCLATKDDPLLAPLRVAWMAEADNAWKPRRLLSLMIFGDPYDPGRIRRWYTMKRYPERCRIVAGEPANLSSLRTRWRDAGGTDVAETTSLPDFVARQAALALERAERRLRGMRYKVPRFVREAISERPAFQGTVATLAWELGSDTADIGHEANSYLREIAATHSPSMIDLAAQFCRVLYTRGYAKKLDYDRRELERIYNLGQRCPVVFLPSHKSNLDHLVLQYALYENGHPPNHTAGGNNMNFFPIGPFLRRSGVFFIRRTFKDNVVYKLVLGHYIDYLIEKRFPLEWYVEGGRSRSGKLLPPRFGMLSYVVDAYRRGKSEDVHLIPVSIVYDQIQDVASYAAEQRGGAKEREGFRWFLKVVRSLGRRYGGIHIRFGEPVSLRETFGEPRPDRAPNADERGIELRKTAFEVAVRINRATPITPTSLVTLALLGAVDRAMTLRETMDSLVMLLDYVRKRQLPLTEDLDAGDPAQVKAVIDALVETDVVSAYTGGPEAVYAIGTDQHLTAAYYRNAVIHFFVNGAITELALLAAGAADVEDREGRFWAETLHLRDLLKFEFFFSEKDEYRDEIIEEIALHDSNWEGALAGSAEDVRNLLLQFSPFSAHLVLRPFLEAYSVVADALESRVAGEDGEKEIDTKKFIDECLGLGRQYHLQKRLRSAESVSNVLFSTAVKLADNREALGPGVQVAERRAVLASEIRDAIRRVDAIEALAAGRRAGLID